MNRDSPFCSSLSIHDEMVTTVGFLSYYALPVWLRRPVAAWYLERSFEHMMQPRFVALDVIATLSRRPKFPQCHTLLHYISPRGGRLLCFSCLVLWRRRRPLDGRVASDPRSSHFCSLHITIMPRHGTAVFSQGQLYLCTVDLCSFFLAL